jgi:hypothetical protein
MLTNYPQLSLVVFGQVLIANHKEVKKFSFHFPVRHVEPGLTNGLTLLIISTVILVRDNFAIFY